jgi:hypothetical protein
VTPEKLQQTAEKVGVMVTELTPNHPNWVRLPDIPQDPVPEEREDPVWR